MNTFDKWNDEENFRMIPPLWQRALDFAATCHNNSGRTLTAIKKEGDILHIREKENIPYFSFIKHLITFLTKECNLSSDGVFIAAALFGVLDAEYCHLQDVELTLGSYAAELAKDVNLICDIPTLLAENKVDAICAIVAAETVYLRLAVCPESSWKEDEAYYAKKEAIFAPLNADDRFAFLMEKFHDTLSDLRQLSRTHNKTAEELFTDWDDENSSPLF